MTVIAYCAEHLKIQCEHPGQPARATTPCACGRPSTVHIRLLPRPLPMFGSAETHTVCAACVPETVKRGAILHQWTDDTSGRQ